MSKILVVTEEDIIKTYSDWQQKRTIEWFNVLKFKDRNLTCSQVSKFLNMKIYKVHSWLCKSAKIPPIYTLEKCKTRNWLPLYPSPELARLIGLNMGDGNIQATLGHTFFCDKSKDMITSLNEFIFQHFGIKGSIFPAGFPGYDKSEYILEISNTAFTRLLHCAGCPKGKKTKQIFRVPEWIMYPEKYGCDKRESLEIKRAFLQGLNDSETTKFALRKDKKFELEEIRFEIYNKYLDQLNFIGQLQTLYKDFSILTVPFHGWRNDNNSWRLGLRIKELPNIVKFLLDIGFFFNRERLEDSIDIGFKVLVERLKNIDRCSIAIKFIEEGSSYGSVSKILGIPISTIFNWKSVGRRPLYFNKQDELVELFKRIYIKYSYGRESMHIL